MRINFVVRCLLLGGKVGVADGAAFQAKSKESGWDDFAKPPKL